MIILYLYDNIIQYKEKEVIKEFMFPKEVMNYGKIKNIPMFETNLKKLAKREKWLNIMTSKKINIILPNTYTECDKEILTVIMQNIGIKEIKYKKENALLSFKKNGIFLNLHNEYLVLTKQERNSIRSRFYPYYIFGNVQTTIAYILKNNSKKRYFFYGNNHQIPQLISEMNNPNLYYFYDYKTYLIKQFIP